MANKVSRAQPDDKARNSKSEPPKNQGDKGDYQRSEKK